MTTLPTDATRAGTVSPRPGAEAEPACVAFPHAGAAQPATVRVVVVTAGSHYGGRYRDYLDELDVPAAVVQSWLDGGHVRLAEDVEEHAGTRDVGDLVDEFRANGR